MSVQRPGLTKLIQILGFLFTDKRTKEKRTVTNPLGGPTFKVKKVLGTTPEETNIQGQNI